MAVFTVTTLADVVDPNDGVLSLREAIADAQSRRGADRIEFDADVFLAGGPAAARTIALAQGELAVAGGGGRLTIDGDLDGDRIPDVILDGGGDSRVLNATGTLRLDGLVITGGRVEGALAEGGGILAETLILRHVSVTGNTADGGTARGGGVAADDVRIIDSSLTENVATGFANETQAEGGAVHARTVSVVRSDFETNTVSVGSSRENGDYSASSSGGAIFASDLVIERSRFITNDARTTGVASYSESYGGAVHATTIVASRSAFIGNATDGWYNGGGAISGVTVAVERSRLEGNRAGGLSGGLYSKGGAVKATTLHIADSAVIDNVSFGFRFADGGGLFAGSATVESTNIRRNSTEARRYDASGGGISAGSATITDSRITGNEVAGGRNGDGGGIDAFTLSLTDSQVRLNGASAGYAARGGGIAGSNVTIDGSTISSNRVAAFSDAAGFGGGIAATTGMIRNTTIADNRISADYVFGGGISLGSGTITHTTITGNRADASDYGAASGGGLQAGNGVTLRNSIVVGNLAENTALDELGGAPVVVSSSLVGGDAALIFAATVVIEAGGRTTVAGALGDNGGFTLTAALRDDIANPAVDTGNPAFGLPTDQRGVPRDASPDLGAYEVGPSPVASGGSDVWG